MSDAATIEAPAAAPAAPAAAAPAAPASAPAAAPAPAAPASLIHGSLPPADPAAPGATPAAASTDFAFAEKVIVKTADGAVDFEATARKAEQARQHLEKRLGTGDVPPANAAEYAFTPPEDLKDFELKPERVEAFKAEAHAQGITAKQFEWMMASYLKAVPDLMEGAAALTANEARAELAKVWTAPADLSANIDAASRALRGLPADLQAATAELGTNPAFIRAMAHFGQMMREDRAPGGHAPPAAGQDIESLQRSPAYLDPKHPDHQRVSRQIREHFEKAYGKEPI